MIQETLEAEGLDYYYLPAAERDRWKGLVYPASLAALNDAGEIGARIKAIIDEANAKYPYME
jgi:hypothetical protein